MVVWREDVMQNASAGAFLPSCFEVGKNQRRKHFAFHLALYYRPVTIHDMSSSTLFAQKDAVILLLLLCRPLGNNLTKVVLVVGKHAEFTKFAEALWRIELSARLLHPARTPLIIRDQQGYKKPSPCCAGFNLPVSTWGFFKLHFPNVQ